MKFVFRHFNILSRPSSIEGHEWEEKHDPEIMLDLKVGLSCLLFLFVAAFLYVVGDVWGCGVFLVVTLFSTLSDAVFYNHFYLDLTDRVTAAIGAAYIIWYCTRWFTAAENWAHALVWAKLLVQVGSGITPFRFLDQCRQFPVRSELWRHFHVRWHVTGTASMLLSLMIGQGMLDNFLASVLDLEVVASVFNEYLLMADLASLANLTLAEPLAEYFQS